MNEPENSLQLGIAAYKAGEKANARTYLLKAVREQPDSEQAWGWLSNTVVNAEERIHCLRQVVRINPANKAADKLLKELESNEWLTATAGPPASSPTEPVKTVVPAPPAPITYQSPSNPHQQIDQLRAIGKLIGSVSSILLFITFVIICLVLLYIFL